MGLTAAERETVISWNDEDNVAYVNTQQRSVITKLKRNPAAVLLEEGVYFGTAWAEFRMPANLVSFRNPRTKRELTDEEREVLAERGRRLGKSRKAK